jgi:hypothetical protein
MNEEEKESYICVWIGDGECCRHPTMYGKSYCEEHHDRMYTTMPNEMANYIIDKEVTSIFQNTD